MEEKWSKIVLKRLCFGLFFCLFLCLFWSGFLSVLVHFCVYIGLLLEPVLVRFCVYFGLLFEKLEFWSVFLSVWSVFVSIFVSLLACFCSLKKSEKLIEKKIDKMRLKSAEKWQNSLKKAKIYSLKCPTNYGTPLKQPTIGTPQN